MANEKLIQDMLKCDGTNKNCKGCAFQDNPECRNAMAHHAGALIQLQDVVIINQAKTIAGLKGDIGHKSADLEELTKLAQQACYQANELARVLHDRKDCKTCANDRAGFGTTEVCDKCRGVESQWELSIYLKHPSLRKNADDDLGEDKMDEENDVHELK